MSSLTIKSSIRDYELFFNQSIFNTLTNELKADDVVFIDQKVFKYLPDEVRELISNNRHFLINAIEKEKSLILIPCLDFVALTKTFLMMQ